MWKCPICGNNEKNEYTCAKCGYDERKDFVQWRTVCKVPREDVKEYKDKMSHANSVDSDKTSNRLIRRLKLLIPIVGALIIVLGVIFVTIMPKHKRIQSAVITSIDDMENAVVFGSDVKRSAIKTITFLNSKKHMPADAWDVSVLQNGSVMAWIENENELYFAANGTIKANPDSSYFFAGYTNLEKIDFNTNKYAFDTSEVTDATGMFLDCQKLSDIMGLGSLDWSRVTQNTDMFLWCDALRSIAYEELWDGNTEIEKNMLMKNFEDALTFMDGVNREIKVIAKRIVFLDSMENVPENARDISKYQNRSVMAWLENGQDLYIAANGRILANPDHIALFKGYQSVEEIHFNGNFDTSRLTNMNWMFADCVKLKTLNLQGFNTSKATQMRSMFEYCKMLENLDLSMFDTSQVTDMSRMFLQCASIKEIDVSCFRTYKAQNMEWMFFGCEKLEKIDVSGFDMRGYHNTENMFHGCEMLSPNVYADVWNGK